MEVVNHLFPPVSVSFSVLALMCNSPFFHLLLSASPDSVTPCSFPDLIRVSVHLSCRSRRSSVPTAEWIFELPHFTVQATRPQTLLLQAICQSWTHSAVNGAPLTLSEGLINEVYKAPGNDQPCSSTVSSIVYLGWTVTVPGFIQHCDVICHISQTGLHVAV